MRKALAVFVALGVGLTLPLAAQNTSILIPTLYSGPGAFGSTWWSSVVVNNHSAADFGSPGVKFSIVCPIPEGCESPTVPSGQFGVIATPRPAAGLLLHGDAAVLSSLAFQGRFGQGIWYLTNGTELPIVREAQFARTALRFPFVTLHLTREPVRSTLRIYGPDAEPGTRVRVELRPWSQPAGEASASQTIDLGVPAQPTDPPLFPGYAQILLQQAFPFEQVNGSSFNISVVPLPLPSGSVPRIWAFITTTENVSQQVSVQTPQ
jgi:hypothetical protein